MYRVLIVDDEPIMRNGVSAIIDWEKERMSAEHDCENGVEALHALENHPFDILITDIVMPLMNGIELMKRALELYPSLKVILLSSYSDFEYAREGLKLGAVDYLLKAALEPEDLLAVLRRCTSMLDEEREKAFKLQESLQGAVYWNRKILEHETKKFILQEQASSFATVSEIEWLNKPYICAYLMLDRAEHWKENRGYMYLQLLLEELQKLFYVQLEEGIALLAAESSMFLLFPDHESEAERTLREWKRECESKMGISISAGFKVELGKGNILKGFSESRLACERRFFEGLGGLYRTKDLGANNGTSIKYKEPVQDWTPFFDRLRNGDPAPSAVEFALERWKCGILGPKQVKQEACSLLVQVGAESVLPEQLELLRGAETLEQLASLLIDQLDEIGKPYLPKLADNGYSGQVITKALEYMSANFTENLTLQSAADLVHLSKNYFSLLFKKQTGYNFIDYLIELRIREAKRLLALSNNRIYDVAGPAGFKDVKYFNKIFKKVTGLTPKEYREKYKVTSSSLNEERMV